MADNDVGIGGVDILIRADLSDEFSTTSGPYLDNDTRHCAPPHPNALNLQKSEAVG